MVDVFKCDSISATSQPSPSPLGTEECRNCTFYVVAWYKISFDSLMLSQAQKVHIGKTRSQAKDEYNISAPISFGLLKNETLSPLTLSDFQDHRLVYIFWQVRQRAFHLTKKRPWPMDKPVHPEHPVKCKSFVDIFLKKICNDFLLAPTGALIMMQVSVSLSPYFF